MKFQIILKIFWKDRLKVNSPKKIIGFNLDGIFEIFLNLDDSKVEILGNSIKNIVENLDDDSKKRIFLLCPYNARKLIGF